MAERKRISLETKPHVIELAGLPDQPADLELLFVPEVYSDEFLDTYAELQDKLKAAGLQDEQDLAAGNVDPAKIKEANEAVREFLSAFMLPNSAELFATLRLPDWVLARMSETVTELYGARPTGSSSASVPASSKAGKRSTAPSRSKGRTPAAGRSGGS